MHEVTIPGIRSSIPRHVKALTLPKVGAKRRILRRNGIADHDPQMATSIAELATICSDKAVAIDKCVDPKHCSSEAEATWQGNERNDVRSSLVRRT